MIYIFAGIFFVLFLLNHTDSRKGPIAALFFWTNLMNCFTTFGGINFYLIGMVPPAVIILSCLQNSQRNWSMVICGIMTSCILINFLGMINFSYLDVDSGYFLYERAIYLTTIAEIAVLLVMPTRLLDGYFTDSVERIRKYFSGFLSIGINCSPYLARVL